MRAILQLPWVVLSSSRETIRKRFSPTEPQDELQTIDRTDPENDAKEYEKEVTTCQAALRLLEMAPNEEDRMVAIRFVLTAPRMARAAVDISPGQRQLVLSLTLDAFDVWRSQPNEWTQETAENFGRALCHVLPHCRGSPERWKELTALTQDPRPTFGRRFLQELESLEHTSEYPDKIREEYILQLALLRTLLFTKDIPIDSFRWTQLRILKKTKYDNSQLLRLWCTLICEGFGQFKGSRSQQSGTSIAPPKRLRQSTRRETTDDDFPLALACGVQALKSIERQATADNKSAIVLDAVEIYNSCIQQTIKLADGNRVLPQFRGRVAKAMTDMMAYFKEAAFLNPTERQMLDFFTSALKLLQSVCSAGVKPSLDDTTFEGLWYTLDSVIAAMEPSTEVKRGSSEDLVLKTIEFITDWLPANLPMDSPMVGLENYPRVIEWIAARFLDETKQTGGRLVQLMYRNRFRWFAQESNALRAAWMKTELSSHLIKGLRRPEVWQNPDELPSIFEDITERSPEWCRRLIADGFLVIVANVIVHFNQLESGTTVPRWCYIQCRLLKALLSVWRHCSAIPGIRWPMEKMLLVVNRTLPVVERLLGQDARQLDPGAQVPSSVKLDREAISNIRDQLISFVSWIENHSSTPISQGHAPSNPEIT
ncbi:hypothetical protein FRC04_001504 [Tulasnella sp. 424]|nr:hypothetical protein FRC04_001504 [Tulasnella sp. 424]